MRKAAVRWVCPLRTLALQACSYSLKGTSLMSRLFGIPTCRDFFRSLFVIISGISIPNYSWEPYPCRRLLGILAACIPRNRERSIELDSQCPRGSVKIL